MDRIRESKRSDLLLAAMAGGLLMYLLDPQHGRRRVRLARQKMTRLARVAGVTTDAGLRDLCQRGTGLWAELSAWLRSDTATDDVLVQRVRSRLGRLTSHPHAVAASATAGCVTLSGPVLAEEEQQLVRGVSSVRGVRRVENRLEVHRSAERIPALQGGEPRAGPRTELMQTHSAPGPRLLSLVGGTALTLYGFGRRSAGGALLGTAGAALALRAAAGANVRRTLGLAGGSQPMDVEKTIRIAAPPEQVFDRWDRFEDFPRFMSRVEEVRRLDGDRSHWVVKGPAGSRLEWVSRVTARVRPELLAWRSEPGSPVQHAGRVCLEEAEDGGTRVRVQMSYRPPVGIAGHLAAALLGRDPKHDLDADLMRMKSFIETGVPAHDAADPAKPPAARARGDERLDPASTATLP